MVKVVLSTFSADTPAFVQERAQRQTCIQVGTPHTTCHCVATALSLALLGTGFTTLLLLHGMQCGAVRLQCDCTYASALPLTTTIGTASIRLLPLYD